MHDKKTDRHNNKQLIKETMNRVLNNAGDIFKGYSVPEEPSLLSPL